MYYFYTINLSFSIQILSKISLYVDLTTADRSWRRTADTLGRTTTTPACCGRGSADRQAPPVAPMYTRPAFIPHRTLSPIFSVVDLSWTNNYSMRPPQVHIRSGRTYDDISLPDIILALQEYCYL